MLRALMRGPRTASKLAASAVGAAGAEAAIHPLLWGLRADGVVEVDRIGPAARYALAGPAPRARAEPHARESASVWAGVVALLWLWEGLYFLAGPAGPLVSDAASYWRAGGHLLRTGVLSTYWPPLYPLLTAGFHLFGGVRLLVDLQTLAVGAIVLAVAGWLRRGQGERAATGFLAAMAMYPALYLNARFVLTDALFAALLLCWLVAATDAAVGRGGFWRSGAVLAIAGLLRPEAIPVCLLASGWLAWRGRWPSAAAMAAPLALASLLWAAYAHAGTGAWSPTEHNFWVNLWAGNNPLAHGLMVYPVRPAHAAAAVYRSLALHWIAGHPLRFVGLSAARGALFWLLPVSYPALLAVEHRLVPPVWFVSEGAATALGCAAWAWVLARRRRANPFAVAGIVGQWAMVVPFFVAARFRLPVLPLLAVLCAGLAAEGKVERA